MRSFIGIFVFVILGLTLAVLIGFKPSFGGQLPYDSEQKGLSDRIILKFSHVVAENTPKGLAAEHFAQLVKERTNGAVDIQVFPNAILYSETTEVDALKRNDVQIIAPSFSYIATEVPEWMVMDLPYAFPNQAAIDEALNGEIGKSLFASLEPHGMKGIGFWGNGFKQMSSSVKPLIEPDDFRGQTFRVQPSPVIESQFEALGANTKFLPFNEVYSNLELQNVNGQENTISNIYSKRLYRVQKYMTLSNHGYLGYAVIVNRSVWEKLPESVRQILNEAMQETSAWINKKAIEINDEQLEAIRREGGIQIHEQSAEERQRWMKALEPLYGEYTNSIGKPLLDKVMELRTRYLANQAKPK